MHYQALSIIGRSVKKYLDPNKKMRILEVGSKSTERASKDLIFRRYFRKNLEWRYIGLDLEEGRNVDIVAEYPYHYPFEDNSFDLVLSGNTLEHVPDLYKWVKELARLTRDKVWILVPHTRPYHAYPVDCWRVRKDGMRFLLEDIAGLKVEVCEEYEVDTLGIGKKIR